MMNHINVFIVLAIFVAVTISQNVDEENKKKIVCYSASWSYYRPNDDKFTSSLIQPGLCTHLIYAFATFSKDYGLAPGDEYLDITLNGYKEFNKLKEENVTSKTLIAIGGWQEGSKRFSDISASQELRAHFSQSVVDFLKKYNFDGINIDWQFPTYREGSQSKDKENLVKLLQDLRSAFDKEAKAANHTNFLLTITIPSEIELIEQGYDLPNLDRYVDFMNIVSYDYHFSHEPKTGHHSPLYPLPKEITGNINSDLNVDATVQFLLGKSINKTKFILGIPTFGRNYKLVKEEEHSLGAPTTGLATNHVGYEPYYKICQKIKQDNWTVVHVNKTALGPYAYKGDQWIGYDDEDIVYQKGKYAREKGLGGIMYWSINDDDFKAQCGPTSFPIVNAGSKGVLGLQKSR